MQGLNWHTLELKAIDNLTLEHIESQLQHNLYPVDAVPTKGEPLRVLSQRVDMKGRLLRWLVENLQANHGYYLLGELYVDADKVVNVSQIETYHPVLWGAIKCICITPGRRICASI